MCLFVYIMVYSSNSNCIAAHVVDTHTSARAWEGKDTNKDVGEQRTYGLGQVHTKIHFLDMNMVQENTHFIFWFGIHKIARQLHQERTQMEYV